MTLPVLAVAKLFSPIVHSHCEPGLDEGRFDYKIQTPFVLAENESGFLVGSGSQEAALVLPNN
jgi:hypothetical protein